MNLQKLVGYLFSPLAFGIGFLSPLAAQSLTLLGVTTAFDNIVLGLLIGLSLGLMAQLRGSWVWVKP